MTKLPKPVVKFLQDIGKIYGLKTLEGITVTGVLIFHPDSPVRKLIERAIAVVAAKNVKLDIETLITAIESLERTLADLEVKK